MTTSKKWFGETNVPKRAAGSRLREDVAPIRNLETLMSFASWFIVGFMMIPMFNAFAGQAVECAEWGTRITLLK